MKPNTLWFVMFKAIIETFVVNESPLIVEGTWDGDKVVVVSFPDEQSFRDGPSPQNIWRLRRTGRPERSR